jgi:hypothetical protein
MSDYPIDEAKRAHDEELAAHTAWVNDPKTASYIWELVRDGQVLLKERTDCGDGPCGDHHVPIAEWPGAWKPNVIGTAELDVLVSGRPRRLLRDAVTRPYVNGRGEPAIEVLEPAVFEEADNPVFEKRTVEQSEPVFAATEPFEPFQIFVTPVTLDHQKLPTHVIPVDPGTQVIWGHRNVKRYDANGHVVAHEETMVIGTRIDGVEHVVLTYPDGATFEHASLSDALKHAHVYADDSVSHPTA